MLTLFFFFIPSLCIVPPKWIHEPKEVSVLKGKVALIDCSADGFPPPNVRWSRTDGKHALASQSFLHLSDAILKKETRLHFNHSVCYNESDMDTCCEKKY